MINAIAFAASVAALLSPALAATKTSSAPAYYFTMGVDGDYAQRMDPILSPGTISQHVHQFFGAGNAAPDSTYDSLIQANCSTVGDSKGYANADDHSLYWHPALYVNTTNSTGYTRVPVSGHQLYYKDVGTGQKAEPFEFPKGFRMIAGNPFLRAANSVESLQSVTQWVCHGPGSPEGPTGGFPSASQIKHCDAWPFFNGAIHFPHCWNGQDFDIANPMAHMSYADDDMQTGTCPDSHPTRLPHVFIENNFDLRSFADSIDKNGNPVNDKVDYSSFVLAQGDDTGFGWHADFMNGWTPGALDALLADCPGVDGDHGVAVCKTYKQSPGKQGACSIPIHFDEKVDSPGTLLPGCNPVVSTNPAPIYAVAPLNDFTNVCQLAGSGTQAAPAYASAIASSAAAYVAPLSSSSIAQAASSSASSAISSPTTPNAMAPSSTPVTGAASNAVDCPDDNGKTYTANNGKTFEVECGTDHTAGNLNMLYANNLTACIEACASHSDCVDVSLSGRACWMKSKLGAAVQRGEVAGAKLVSGSSGSSPSATGSLVTTTTVIATHTEGEVEYLTEVVTIAKSFPTPMMKARDERFHAHVHRHAKFHVGRRAF